MSENSLYLHFRSAPSPATLALLQEHSTALEQIFETSYRVTVPMSVASFRRLVLFNAPQEEYCLVKYRDLEVVSPKKHD